MSAMSKWLNILGVIALFIGFMQLIGVSEREVMEFAGGFCAMFCAGVLLVWTCFKHTDSDDGSPTPKKNPSNLPHGLLR